MLKQYSAKYPEESLVVEKINDLVTSYPDCFERTCHPGHITGSAWVLSQDRTQCLLVHHRKLDRWLQPGGHADGQSDVEKVALREAQEESGLTGLELQIDGPDVLPLDIDIHRIPARQDTAGNIVEESHEHHDIRFLFVSTRVQALVLSEESHDLRWFSHQEVMNVTSEESVLRMLRKAGPFPC